MTLAVLVQRAFFVRVDVDMPIGNMMENPPVITARPLGVRPSVMGFLFLCPSETHSGPGTPPPGIGFHVIQMFELNQVDLAQNSQVSQPLFDSTGRNDISFPRAT